MQSKRASLPAITGLAGVILALGIWVLSGCNVFTPFAADKDSELSYRGLILKGSAAINDGNYDAAESYFNRAMALNPRGSEAFLFHAKAIMSKYELDYTTLNNEFEIRRNKDGNGKKGLPFIDSNTTPDGIDSIYYPIATAVSDLQHIIRKVKDPIQLDARFVLAPDGDTASDGKISEGVARLDLGLIQAIQAMLAPLDLDSNKHIDNQCGRNVCPNLSDMVCKEQPLYKARCKEQDSSEVIRFRNFKKLSLNVDIESLNSKDVRARNVSTNPNDINAFLDAMQGPIAGSNFNLDSVTGVMNSHQEAKLSGQLAGIVANIKDLNGFLSYMRFDDSLDNDYDHVPLQAGATASRITVWHDFDRDLGIRWDYDDSLPVSLGGIATGYAHECYNLGHPAHRYMYKGALYQRYSDMKVNPKYKDLFADTSKNSRIALMKKKCAETMDSLPLLAQTGPLADPLLRQDIRDNVCTTYTSLILENKRPRPGKSDWVDGPMGVDEEMIDERDNDHDGIQDEDARNAQGMDDDDDALLSVTLLGTTPQPMRWTDAPTHHNTCGKNGAQVNCACPDIDTNVPMSRYAGMALGDSTITDPAVQNAFQRAFCVGALEHRIYLAGLPNGNDSLFKYYSQFLGEGANANCLDDFDKLDLRYRQEMGKKFNTNQETMDRNHARVRLACRYKHIWAQPHPPRSEWFQGLFGIDEEIPDGADNDGDGWTDEDVR